MQPFDPFDGALLVDKPAGPTSHDIVEAVRRRFGLKKVGHCGTLDPNATGLLVLVLGRATKLSEKLMAGDKTYEGSIEFGETTSTHDSEGELTGSLPVPPLTLDELNQTAAEFVGDLMQTPPMVSAIKKDGVPLYKLARQGIEVERKARLVHIYSFRFSRYEEPIGEFRIVCTKGTYVRTLAHDLGQKIGCGAHLRSLRRVASGSFEIEKALPLDDIMNLTTARLQERVIPMIRLVETH